MVDGRRRRGEGAEVEEIRTRRGGGGGGGRGWWKGLRRRRGGAHGCRCPCQLDPSGGIDSPSDGCERDVAALVARDVEAAVPCAREHEAVALGEAVGFLDGGGALQEEDLARLVLPEPVVCHRWREGNEGVRGTRKGRAAEDTGWLIPSSGGAASPEKEAVVGAEGVEEVDGGARVGREGGEVLLGCSLQRGGQGNR